jgi:hypothetical protein
MRVVTYACLIALFEVPALAQTAIPPPPKPADSGPSLAATMQFIQEKLSEQGRVNFAVYTHDNADNTDRVDKYSVENTNVKADPAECSIQFHINSTFNGSLIEDRSTGHKFQDIAEIEIRTGEQHQNQIEAESGHPTRETKVNPRIFVLVGHRRGVGKGGFYFTYLFTDEDTANRVAKAMTHAVELCGGGNNDPF